MPTGETMVMQAGEEMRTSWAKTRSGKRKHNATSQV
jgi:hypothetical protein